MLVHVKSTHIFIIYIYYILKQIILQISFPSGLLGYKHCNPIDFICQSLVLIKFQCGQALEKTVLMYEL